VPGTIWVYEAGDIDGSWTGGVESAKVGIIMPINPVVGDVYRQEFALGDAEDMGEILSLTASESVPGASCTGDCVQTRDFSPLEPGVEAHKYYAPNIGVILEVEDGDRVELISMTKP